MKNKTLFNSLFLTFSFIGSCLVLNKPIKANDISPSCPDPSVISEIGDINSNTNPSDSFISLTTTSPTEKGYCKTTPELYGVKVFKMGFCEKNPGNPSGLEILVGQNIDYSSCSWGFENTNGMDAAFTATSSIDLPEANSSRPAAGTYPYAVMIMSNELKIKGKYGPIGDITYYTRDASSLTDYGATTDINEYAASTSPVLFAGPDTCLATAEGLTVTGGTMSGYLLDNTGKIIDAAVANKSTTTTGCTEAEKLLGVVTMTNDLIIDDNTNGLKMTFGVTDAMNATLDNNNGEIEFISKAFSVTFETF